MHRTTNAEDVRRFQLSQHEAGVGAGSINGAVSALRFLFTVTLKRQDLARALVIVRHLRKLPEVLSIEKAARLPEAAPGLKYKAALGVAYSAGRRVSEVAHLKVDDIDSTRMLIRVEQGKGRKDRNAMLSPQLLELLCLWWREGRRRGVMLPHGWLFPGRSCMDPISSRQLHRAVQEVAEVAGISKALVYDLLFRAASETVLTIAADPKHLGARIGITAVLHTWSSAMTHHPHVHMIVPGGGITPDGNRWISSRPAFLSPVQVLGKLFRRLFLTRLIALHDEGRLVFLGSLAHLAQRRTFVHHLAPVRRKRWVVYANASFAEPEAVLAHLSRYTHRVTISNSRLIAFDAASVAFRYKD